MAATCEQRRPRTGWLATPLTRDERRHVTRMYREHRGLLNLLGRKLCRKYPFLQKEDIFSCIDFAFIKTCRAWDESRGTFSTLLTVFAEGDILHFIRDHNWMVKAPGKVRQLGQVVRRLQRDGSSATEIRSRLSITDEQLRLALLATQPVDEQSVYGFDVYACPRPTPWELLSAENSG